MTTLAVYPILLFPSKFRLALDLMVEVSHPGHPLRARRCRPSSEESGPRCCKGYRLSVLRSKTRAHDGIDARLHQIRKV
jgi:hypothetical protein